MKGGARIGAGRPEMAESERRKQVQYSLHQNELDIIEEYSKKLNIPKSRFLVECIHFYEKNH